MEIREITGDKRRYLPLLLVGDEQEEPSRSSPTRATSAAN